MFQNILETLAQYSLLEWIGLFSGIIYVILSAQNKIICWFFGIISCACIAYHDFFGGIKLYSDGVLQIIYIIMGFVGLYRWRFRKIMDDTNKVSSRIYYNHIYLISGSIFLSFIYGYLMIKFTDGAFPFLDAFTTVLSISATILLVNRQLSAWIYFILIDSTMTILYYVRGWDLYALLYLIFTVVAVYATWKWKTLASRKMNSI